MEGLFVRVTLGLCVAGTQAAAQVHAAPQAPAPVGAARAVNGEPVANTSAKRWDLRMPRLDSLQFLSGLDAALKPLRTLPLGSCGLVMQHDGQSKPASPSPTP
ncbi:hypothetical protein GCM10025771_38760 [Niveibacterium umoris]|uniref:Uncharacterized protein n=1 Tax=Niveibacterium umoris TaxID=1193620 RepID=A0A840BH46_9RHOO|nr:hypothetical protein [Niveibacterium umoris]MBB4010922.1 hypothetical protein [Niveibacterium umoris]